MSNARLIIDNLADSANVTLTTGTEIATLPVTNLQIYNNSRLFRTNDNSLTITVAFAGLSWISGLALWKHNLGNQATVQILALDEAGAQVLDTGVQPAMDGKTLGEMDWGISALEESFFDDWRLSYSVFWFDLTAAKTVTITITDPGRVDPIDITRLYLGRSLEPSFNFDWGNGIEWQDKSKQHNTAGGSSYSVESEVWREAQLQLANLSDTDRPHFFDAFRKVSTQKDWFISMYPDAGGQLERDYSFAAKLRKPVNMTRPDLTRYKTKLPIREV